MKDFQTHLSRLEVKEVEIMREVVSEPETPEIRIDKTAISIDDTTEQSVKQLLVK